MNTRVLGLCLVGIFLFGIQTSSVLAQETTDKELIHKMLSNYVEGWREGDEAKLRSVFALDEGRVVWIATADGKEKLQAMTFEKIVQRGKKQPAYGLEWDILALDIIDGRLAVAKLEISRKGGSYVDILTCHKIEGQWRIVNKAFVTRKEDGE